MRFTKTFLFTVALLLCFSVTTFADETNQEAEPPITNDTGQETATDDDRILNAYTEASDFLSSTNDTVKLKFLTQKRKEVIQDQVRLSKKIRAIENDMLEQEESARKGSHFDEFYKKTQKISQRIESIAEEIYDINQKAVIEPEDSPLRTGYDKKITQLNALKALHEAEEERLQYRLNEETAAGQWAGRATQEMEPRLEQVQTQYDQTTITLLKIENDISELLNRDSLKNDFRVKISAAFTALVAVVIIGFYWLAFRKDEISKNIFTGEKGIQFITLFLIVIAIILFGIMGTLESRELSALLGALSGYILGKTSTEKS